MTPEQRMEQMVQAIGGAGYPLTEKQICDTIGIRKTPYSRELLARLVNGRHILKQWRDDYSPPRYVYLLPNWEPGLST